MDAWTAFGLFKLFIDIIDGGPSAAVKGILLSGLPHSGLISAGESVYQIFGLDGSYKGEIDLNEINYVHFHSLNLINEKNLKKSVANLDFPEIQKRHFAKFKSPEIKKRNFPKF